MNVRVSEFVHLLNKSGKRRLCLGSLAAILLPSIGKQLTRKYMLENNGRFTRMASLRRIAAQVLICGTIALGAQRTSQAETYNLSADFSPTNNPSGAWSYGAKPTLDGSFSLFEIRGLNPFEYWQLIPAQEPTIYRNGTSETIHVGDQGVFPPGTVFLYSGTDGATNPFGVVRFTMPSGGSGDYFIQVEVLPVYSGGSQGDTDFHVTKNGSELFGRSLAPSAQADYADTLSLSEGDILDFMVGRGEDNSGTGSGLRLSVSISPASPASSFVANGSFELGEDPGSSSDVSAPDSTTITGWAIETASVDYIGTRWVAGDGERCLDLSGTAAGTIGQMISGLTAGQRYRLSFLMAANPEVGTFTARLSASIGDANNEFSFEQSGFSTSDLGWTEKTMDFSASATEHKLTFTSLNPGWAGAALDRIVIQASDIPPLPVVAYDLSAGFSVTANPSGAWSYGYVETLDGLFTPFSFNKSLASENGVAIFSWQVGDAELPGVTKVVGDGVAVSAGGSFTAPSGTVYLTPGNDGSTRNFAVARFTVPAGESGVYQIETRVSPVFDGPSSGDSDFHVTRNGQELIGEFLPPNTPWSYTNTVQLVAGDTIDFAVGRGADGLHAGTTALKLQALLVKTSAPPPPPPSGLVFNLSEGISTNSNPNGSWSYGWAAALGGNIELLTGPYTAAFNGGKRATYWALTASQYPAVYKNPLLETITAGGAAYAPGEVWFIPGAEGGTENYGVIRFTVPTGAGGNYILGATVAPAYSASPQGDSDFHIVKNGVELFSEFLAPADRTTYTNELTVVDGDTIDFVIGRGADGRLYGSILRIAASLTATTNSSPPFIIVQPQGQQLIRGTSAFLHVVAAGSAPLHYQWRKDGTDLEGATNSTFALSDVTLSDAGSYSVVVNNDLGSITSHVANIVVNLGPSVIRVISTSASSEGQVDLTVELVANGNENAIGFSLNFNPSLLTFTQASQGETALEASLILNTNELTNGRLGLALALPAGTTFAEGVQQLVRISFDAVSATQSATTQIGFGDQPVLRQISDINAATLSATYTGGSVSIEVTGLEADVAPRPDGNNAVTITDWVQLGRYVAALDSIEDNLEFQRADCAPREGRGNGVISVSDWVQAGRYAAGLDPIRPAGGPNEPAITLAAAGAGIQAAAGRVLMVPATNALPGTILTLPVWLDSAGNENALAFTLSFDSASLQFISATKLSKMSAATLNVNTNLSDNGKIGIAMALPTGTTTSAGLDPILLLNFEVAPSATGSGSLSFGDSPVFREVADASANPLTSVFTGANVVFGPPIPVGPALTAARSGSSLLLFWPSSAQGFKVYSASSLNAVNWTLVTGTPVEIGGQWLMTAPLAESPQFFRLEKR